MLKSLRRFFSDPVFAKKKAFLKSLSLFKDVTDREIGFLLQSLHSRSYEEGEVFFVENDIGRALFIIEKGRVELTKQGVQGRRQHLAYLGPGDFFGEMALLEHLPRSASAVAVEKSLVHLLYKTKLEDLIYHHPRIGVAIMHHLAALLSSRLRHTTQLKMAQQDAAAEAAVEQG